MIQHGTESAYRRSGCRCDLCMRNQRRVVKLRSMRRAGLVSAKPVQDLFIKLQKQGLSNLDIGAAARIDDSKVSKFRLGQITQVRMTTFNRIMSADYSIQQPGTRCDGEGTRRRLRALSCMGWPIKYVARECGLPTSTLGSVASADNMGTSVGVREAVRAFYERHAGTIGPSNISRVRARKRGWLPPLAWDDDIDDPQARPIREIAS